MIPKPTRLTKAVRKMTRSGRLINACVDYVTEARCSPLARRPAGGTALASLLHAIAPHDGAARKIAPRAIARAHSEDRAEAAAECAIPASSGQSAGTGFRAPSPRAWWHGCRARDPDRAGMRIVPHHLNFATICLAIFSSATCSVGTSSAPRGRRTISP